MNNSFENTRTRHCAGCEAISLRVTDCRLGLALALKARGAAALRPRMVGHTRGRWKLAAEAVLLLSGEVLSR